MTDWTSKWRKAGGWFNEQVRHSNAARFGKAGGKYRKYFAEKNVKREVTLPHYIQIIDGPGIVTVRDNKHNRQVNIKTSNLIEGKDYNDMTVKERTTAIMNKIKKLEVPEWQNVPQPVDEVTATALKTFGEGIGELKSIKRSMVIAREPRTKFVEAAPKATEEANLAAIEVLRRGGSLKEARTEAMKQYARRGFPLESIRDEKGNITKWGARDLYAPEEKSLTLMAKQAQSVKIQEFKEKHVVPALRTAGTALSPILPQMLTPTEKLKKLQTEASIRAMEAAKRKQEERSFSQMVGGEGGGGINPFNPLKNVSFGSVFETPQPLREQMAFGSAPERREPTKEEIHPEAVHLEKEINDLYQGRGALKDNSSKSSYDKGVSAFSGGNREKLVESVNELQAEKRKLVDRNVWLDQSRARLMKEETKQSFIDMEGSGSGLFNFGFGGSGTKKLAELSKKINEAKSDVWKEVNKNEIRMHNLTDKLARLDARMNPGRYEPVTPESGDIVPFSGVAGGAVFTGIDNPLLSKKRPGPILRNDTVSYLLFEPHIKYGSAKIENVNENPMREAR